MGAWGAGLYSNDFALDLKGTISVLAKLPQDGAALCALLLADRPWAASLDDEDADLFWYVLADQFEKRGIACPTATQQALIRLAREPGPYGAAFNPSEQRQWLKHAAALRDRLENPRPVKPRPDAKAPPPFLAEVGEVFAFPTMKGQAFNSWFATWADNDFVPDGWGALWVLDRGRVYVWLPYLTASPLSVPAHQRPTLDDARAARLWLPQTVHRLPDRAHHRRMGLQSLGVLPVDAAKIAALPQDIHSPLMSVVNGWRLCGIAFNKQTTYLDGSQAEIGPPVAALLAEG